MKNSSENKTILNFAVVFLFAFTTLQAQKISFTGAYNMLNSGNKYGESKKPSLSNATVSLGPQSYSHKVRVSYDIPTEIAIEYAIVKTNMNSDLVSDPATYQNSSANVKQAFNNLAYADFVKISEYGKVMIKLNFRFNPPKLIIYGSDAGDFLNNSTSSPWDVQVYKAPNTPVSATKMLIIQK